MQYAAEPNAPKAAMNLGMASLRAVPQSPISDLLAKLAGAIESAHTGMTVLEEKLAPVSAPVPPVANALEKPMASLPSEVEQHLFRLLGDIERLTARMGTVHNDLRI